MAVSCPSSKVSDGIWPRAGQVTSQTNHRWWKYHHLWKESGWLSSTQVNVNQETPAVSEFLMCWLLCKIPTMELRVHVCLCVCVLGWGGRGRRNILPRKGGVGHLTNRCPPCKPNPRNGITAPSGLKPHLRDCGQQSSSGSPHRQAQRDFCTCPLCPSWDPASIGLCDATLSWFSFHSPALYFCLLYWFSLTAQDCFNDFL